MLVEWFPGRLRELRIEASMTQDELASRVGVKREAIARWEAGKREPSWGNVLALCAALGVDCTAFTVEPQDAPAPERGRPRKTDAVPEASSEQSPPAKKRKRK